MSKPFNQKFVRQMLQEENKFISDIFSKMPLPMSELVNQDQLLVIGQDTKLNTKGKLFSVHGGTSKRAQTFEELHAKLESLKSIKKLDYKKKMMKKSLKNRIKKRTKKEERLAQKKLARTEHAAGEGKNQKKEVEVLKMPRPKPVFNSDGKMVFSKFDFSEIGTKKKPPKNENDPRKILQNLEERKQTIKKMEESGNKEKAMEIAEKDAWKNVLAKASGEKVKDDPELLKRSIKKQDQKKKHSAKKWESRIDGVQKSIQERQEKRRENIMKRAKDKKRPDSQKPFARYTTISLYFPNVQLVKKRSFLHLSFIDWDTSVIPGYGIAERAVFSRVARRPLRHSPCACACGPKRSERKESAVRWPSIDERGKMRVPLLLLGGIVVLSVAVARALSCVCSPLECDVLSDEDCPGGLTWDPCRCCKVCARVEGEPCGGLFGFSGSCAVGLQCVIKNLLHHTREVDEGVCAKIPGRWRRHCPSGPIMSDPGCNLVGEGVETGAENVVPTGKCVCGPSVPWCPDEPPPYMYMTRHECKLNLAAKIAYDDLFNSEDTPGADVEGESLLANS
ncbi:hypothetical protein KM043_004678 [Ampulex compressa]|nr:hypothetical protein KM043_004678 [Ampulex compressa]